MKSKLPSKKEVLEIIKNDLESEFEHLEEKMKLLSEHIKIVEKELKCTPNLSNNAENKLANKKELLKQGYSIKVNYLKGGNKENE